MVAIPGDVGSPGLGLSADDKQILIRNVHIVFHCAATLDFEASLRTTVTINLLGTREVVSLSKEITNLKVSKFISWKINSYFTYYFHFRQALLHVSSAYANSDKVKVDEIIYPLQEDPDKVINLVSTLKDEDLDEITPKWVKSFEFFFFQMPLVDDRLGNILLFYIFRVPFKSKTGSY